MARGVYNVIGNDLTLANQAVTLVFINPASATGIEILRCWIGFSGNATSAQQRVQLVTQVTAFPTLVSATPQLTSLRDAASQIVGGTAGAAGTSGINASAEGAGAKTVRVPDAFNVLNGYLWLPTADEKIQLPAGSTSGFGLFLPAAAATLTGWSCGVTFRELGG